MNSNNLDTSQIYALLERYANGEYVSDIGLTIGLSVKEILSVLRSSVTPSAFELATKKRSECLGGQESRLQRRGG